MPGWRLAKVDGSDQRANLSLAQVRALLEEGAYGPADLVASPKQDTMLKIGDVPALHKFVDAARPEPAAPPTRPAPKLRSAPTPTPRLGGRVSAAALAMILPATRRRPLEDGVEEEELEISAMIDVVFQLLIFFMVCSVIQPTAAVNLPQTETGTGLDPQSCVILNVRTTTPEEGRGSVAAFLGDHPDELMTIPEAARAAAERVGQTQTGRIILGAARDVPYRAVRDLLIELRKHTDAPVVTGVKERT